MASNHKLTGVLRGRQIRGTGHVDNVLTVLFDDGSTMTVNTAGTTNSVSRRAVVKAVRQAETVLELDFEDGRSMAIPLAEETACVMVRDKNRVLEYAD